MEFLGAKVEVIPSRRGISKGFNKQDIEETLKRAKEIAEAIPGAFLPNQFENPDNPMVHAQTTAIEIIEQTEGRLSAFVAACGTGGTFSGVAEVLKMRFPGVKRIVVEPAGSAVISGCEAGFHKIQGIGEGFVPMVMNLELVDQVIQVCDEDAIATARRLAREEGILTGFSGGANVFASLEIGKSLKEGQIIATIIPDNGLRYLSTELFEQG
jgi:cysteine synthase A